MGCDIHLLIEQLVEGKWITVRLFRGFECQYDGKYRSPPAACRNYERFAALAGVRGIGPEPRGIPEDLSDTARFLIDDYQDGHSHSWLPVDDAAQIFLKTEQNAENCISEFHRRYPHYYYFGLEREIDEGPHRLVFWFDN